MRIVDKGNDIIIEGHLYSLVCDTIGTATIKVYEDNAYLTSVTTDEYGFFHIVIPTSTVGVRNFKLIYEGDSNYTGSESTTIEVTVRDAPVLDEIILVSDKLVCQLGERFHFTATCQSQYDDDLANIQVQLRKDDVVIQTVTTGTDGKAYLKFTPNATGSYSITATSGNVSSDPILVVVSEGNIYEIIADLNEFPGTYSKEEIDALLLALKTLLEESKADVGHIHQIRDIPNLQALLDDKVTWEAFYNSGGGGGGGGDVPIVANWTSNPSDSRVPSEKLTKNTLDTKSDVGHTHDDRYYTETEIDTALLIKQDLLVSGTNIKTINNQSILGSGNITIEGGGGSDVDIVTSWEPTPSDTKVPSEKLTKNTLDTKVDKVTGKGLSTNDFTNSYKNTIDGLSTVATTGDYDDLSNKPSIPSSSSDLSDGSDLVKKSSTSGLIKNDGTIDTTSYSTFSGSYNDLTNRPTIPSASTTTPSADTSSGSYGSGTSYARSNHTHPKSSLYAEATHSHTKSQITDFPTIPTNTSDLTNDGADGTNVFVANNDSRLSDARTPTSHTHGQITNAGAITSTAVTVASGDNIVITDASDSSKVKRVTNLLAGHIKDSTAHTNIGSSANDTQATINSDIDTALSNKVSKSSTSGLLKNDGTVDTTQYLSSLPAHNHDDRYYTESEVDTALGGKQATLVSGTNIKTINNTSLLGSGNINIQGGGTVTIDDSLSTTSTNPVQNKVITGALNGKANSSHTHTKSEITDFPSIPSKTSDLTNDGDGTNVFVKDNDSRLSNARTPLAHTHLSSDVTDLIDVIYPVGSIYMSVNSTSPQTLFGGTWEQIKDTFLLASGDTYANGTTGGSADAVTVSHTHSFDRAYALTTDSTQGVDRNSSAGQTGTKVNNLLQSNGGAIYRNTINSTGESGTGKNMPPYLTVFVWKRTA